MKDFYLFNSIYIGLVLAYEAYLLYQVQGRIIRNKMIFVTSSLEFVWILFTWYVLFTVDFSRFEILIPVLFACFTTVGLLHSLFLQQPPPEGASLEEAIDIQAPKWYVNFQMSFGPVFAIASACVFFLYSS